ncbi:hypothetical protein NB037_06415 [Rathayibacter sp. ZW T2_19]|uniref:Uncharacterized protein n=1 Tax=Rathayibacter rubneri TaxID=2950106 RepID=A0A9X2DXI8_9MICO|nr:hypothetical protein [Rathayibacter rubneri]MCM6762051.1 hypothetical protein [Rathayibacter rubneri]
MARSSTRRRGRIGAVAAALLVLLPLAGCAGPTPYSDFERERTEADVLPEAGGIDTGIDPESVRFVGTAEGVDVYIGLSDERGRCVVVDDGADSASGCSGSGGLETSKPGAWTVRVHPDGEGPEDAPGLDWTALGENVSVRAG